MAAALVIALIQYLKVLKERDMYRQKYSEASERLHAAVKLSTLMATRKRDEEGNA
jgi:hypothetical protein